MPVCILPSCYRIVQEPTALRLNTRCDYPDAALVSVQFNLFSLNSSRYPETQGEGTRSCQRWFSLSLDK